MWVVKALNEFKSLIEWLVERLKIMFVLCMLCGLGLFLPPYLQTKMNIESWTSAHPVLLWGLFLFCAIWLFLSFLQATWRILVVWRKLNNLSPEEKTILRYYIKENKSASAWLPVDMAARNLHDYGILVSLPKLELSAENQQKMERTLYYRIRPIAAWYLGKRSHLFV